MEALVENNQLMFPFSFAPLAISHEAWVAFLMCLAPHTIHERERERGA